MAIAKTEIEEHVSDFLGWGVNDLSTLEEARLDRILDMGYRMYISPPRINQDDEPHRWGWLRDTYFTTLTIDEPAMYLPQNFSHLVSPVSFSETVVCGDGNLQEIGWSDLIRKETNLGGTSSGIPVYCSINHQPASIHNPASVSSSSSLSYDEAVSVGSTVMRFYPKPDKAYKIQFQYEKTATSFPTTSLGPDEWNDLLREACLAQAEKEEHDAFGVHYQAYLSMLDDLIRLDRLRNPHTMDNLGKMRPTYDRHGGNRLVGVRRNQTHLIEITHENQ